MKIFLRKHEKFRRSSMYISLFYKNYLLPRHQPIVTLNILYKSRITFFYKAMLQDCKVFSLADKFCIENLKNLL